MNKDVQRLREPGAWVLLGSAAVNILSGLIGLLFGGGRLSFTYQALQYVTADEYFTGLAAIGIVVIAVLLATRLGGPPTRGARNIALAGLIVLGAIALLELICMLAGLGAGDLGSGVLLDNAASAKATMILYGLSKLAVLAVAGYYILTVFQGFQSAPGYAAPGQPYPHQQQGWGQPAPQAPYGQPAYGPPPQQPGYAQPPQQQQPYAPQGGYARPPYGQPGYPPPPQQPGVHQPPPMGQQPQPQSPPQPPPPPPASPAPVPQPAATSQPAESDGEGEWTRAYGTAETASKTEADKPEDSPPERSSSNDPYMPPE